MSIKKHKWDHSAKGWEMGDKRKCLRCGVIVEKVLGRRYRHTRTGTQQRMERKSVASCDGRRL